MGIKSICINKKHNIDSIILKLMINMKSNSTVPFNSRKYNMVDNETNGNKYKKTKHERSVTIIIVKVKSKLEKNKI